MTEPKTVISITIDNQNNIVHNVHLEGLEEPHLRIVHSILAEHELDCLDKISELKATPQNPF